MLKFVFSMEAEVTKEHRINKFKQDYNWDYIDLNTDKRADAKTEPDRDIFKLMNKALFDKTCENPLRHIKAKILTDEYQIFKSVSKPTIKDIFRHWDTDLKEFY